MDASTSAHIAAIVEDYVQAAGIILGGIWATYRFGIARERESALGFEVAYSCNSRDDTEPRLVTFDVTVINKSKVKLEASWKSPAYTDDDESLKYSASLLLRHIDTDGQHAQSVTWFDGASVHSPRTLSANMSETPIFPEFSVRG